MLVIATKIKFVSIEKEDDKLTRGKSPIKDDGEEGASVSFIVANLRNGKVIDETSMREHMLLLPL